MTAFQCSTCKWFDHRKEDRKGHGICRYNPPSVIPIHIPRQQLVAGVQQEAQVQLLTAWPTVSEEDRCGSFAWRDQ